MNTVTVNSSPDEGAAFEIPQLDDDGLSGRAQASGPSEAGTDETIGLRQAELASAPSVAALRPGSTPVAFLGDVPAAPRRSAFAVFRASLEAAEARADLAEQRALRAEARLARHQRHCICRAGEVADAVDAEADGCGAADATMEAEDDDPGIDGAEAPDMAEAPEAAPDPAAPTGISVRVSEGASHRAKPSASSS